MAISGMENRGCHRDQNVGIRNRPAAAQGCLTGGTDAVQLVGSEMHEARHWPIAILGHLPRPIITTST